MIASRVLFLSLSVSLVSGLLACSNDTGGGGGSTTTTSTSSSGTGGQGAGGQGAGGSVQELGFAIRFPQSHAVTCSEYPPGLPTDPQPFTDADWLCTFVHGGVNGYVYIQSTPVDCVYLMSAVPKYQTKVAQIAIDGKVSDLQNAQYDWGGNHHNDSLVFDYQGKTFQADHSSFGFGWRSCQNMDCLKVSQNGTLAEDGCTKERTLPIVCMPIKADATHDALVDTFAPCAGDPNYP